MNWPHLFTPLLKVPSSWPKRNGVPSRRRALRKLCSPCSSRAKLRLQIAIAKWDASGWEDGRYRASDHPAPMIPTFTNVLPAAYCAAGRFQGCSSVDASSTARSTGIRTPESCEYRLGFCAEFKPDAWLRAYASARMGAVPPRTRPQVIGDRIEAPYKGKHFINAYSSGSGP